MSDYESQSGKIMQHHPRWFADNIIERFEDLCKRLWVENGMLEEEYKEGKLFEVFYEKYLCVKDTQVWEILEVEDLEEEDSFCRLHDNKDGTYSFHTRYYNGGTCMSEMLEDEIKTLKNEKSQETN